MAIETTGQALRVADVTELKLSDIALDTDSGKYVREVRISTAAGLVLTVRVDGATEAAVSVTTPQLTI